MLTNIMSSISFPSNQFSTDFTFPSISSEKNMIDSSNASVKNRSRRLNHSSVRNFKKMDDFSVVCKREDKIAVACKGKLKKDYTEYTFQDFMKKDISFLDASQESKNIYLKQREEKLDGLACEDKLEQKKNYLNKYSLCNLKKIAKKINLSVTAKKRVLIDRILEHYLKIKSTILIQKTFRGFIVRISFQLRGAAFKNRSLCVNDNDGFTLEPINEIPFERFYSFTDNKHFIYGFDLILLYISYKKNNRIVNPFSREPFSSNETNNILRLEKKINILFPYIYEKDEISEIQKYTSLVVPSSRRPIPIRTSQTNTTNLSFPSLRRVEHLNHIRFFDDEQEISFAEIVREGSPIRLEENNNNNFENNQPREPNQNEYIQNIHSQSSIFVTPIHLAMDTENLFIRDSLPSFSSEERTNTNLLLEDRTNRFSSRLRLEESLNSRRTDESYYTNQINLNSESYSISNQRYLLLKKMEEIRSHPIHRRIENLFIEIDLLGNYTSSSWFNDISNYSIFFIGLHSIWNYRIVTNIQEKRKISQLYDPFMTHTIYNTRNMSNEEIKEVCVSVMENLIHGGIDEEYRKLGVYRVLMALTMVNLTARNSFMWLYESIV